MWSWRTSWVLLFIGGMLVSCRTDVTIPATPTPTLHTTETPVILPSETASPTQEVMDSEEGDQSDSLFTETASVEELDATSDPDIVRTRFVKVNFDVLNVPEGSTESQLAGKFLELNLFDDVVFKVIVDRVTTDPLGRVTWTGRLEGEGPSRVSIVVNNEMMVGEIESPEIYYRVDHVDDGVHVIYEYARSAFDTTEGPPVVDSNPHVSPQVKVAVEYVEVRLLETDPVQVELVIKGTLPDQCKYELITTEDRTDDSIKITLEGLRPPENCQDSTQNIEYVLLLGRDLPEPERGFNPGNYELRINDYQTSFSIISNN